MTSTNRTSIALASIIREVSAGYIYDDDDADRLQQEIVLVDVRNPVAQMIVPAPRTRMSPLSSARRSLEMRIVNSTGLVVRAKERTHYSSGSR